MMEIMRNQLIQKCQDRGCNKLDNMECVNSLSFTANILVQL